MLDGLRVLVIEDDADLRTLLRELLREVGAVVHLAEDGAVALNALRAFDPQVILCDIQMPVMDGYQFVATYRAQPGTHAPVVAFTASARSDRAARGMGTPWVLAKPFHLDELVDVLTAAANDRAQQ